MAIIQGEYNIDNGTGYDTVYLKTKAELVETNDGDDVETILNSHSLSLADNTMKTANIISANKYGAHAIEEVGYETFDSTTAINSAISSAPYGSHVVLNAGTYIVGNLIPKSGVSLWSLCSKLKFKNGATGDLLSINGLQDINIEGIKFDGGNTTAFTTSSVKGNRNAIKIYGDSQRINIDKCYITGFDGDGICITYVGYSTVHAKAVKISNTDTDFNYTGVNLTTRGEYCQLINVTNSKNRIGMIVIGSNTECVNVNCSDNVDGLHLLLTAGANDSHSQFANCQFNHNTNYALYGKDFTVGVSFVGCHAHANTEGIFLDTCSGFTWRGGQIRSTNISADGGGYNAFTDNIFDDVAITHAKNGNADKTEFTGNYKPDGTVVTPLSNVPNYLIDRSVTAVSNISAEEVIKYDTNSATYLYGQTTTTIYDSTTGIGTIKFRGLYNISANVAVANPSGSNVNAELRIYQDSTVIKRKTYVIPANSTSFFIDIEVLKLMNENNTWKVSLIPSGGSLNILTSSNTKLLVANVRPN